MEENTFLIVAGASAGGMNALCRLVTQMQPDWNAALIIVIHLPQKVRTGAFLARLQKCTLSPCHAAAHRMALEKGHIYLAPPGHHLLIGPQELLLSEGPTEGRWRPSIDTSFRSAAVAWNAHSIGIVLSGMLDDGTAGMDAIQRCGGFTVVQDPNEAEYPDMPQSVIRKITVDECLPVDAMGKALENRIGQNVEPHDVPEDLRAEALLVQQGSTTVNGLKTLGQHSVYSCPACGGGLWELKEGSFSRYRCHIGHAFTELQLLTEQDSEVEKSLWVAIRTLEEKRNLLEKIAGREQQQGLHSLSEDHYERATSLQSHIARLKNLLFAEHKDAGQPDRDIA
jgi:two-component system chemotaxis response regulator CheB